MLARLGPSLLVLGMLGTAVTKARTALAEPTASCFPADGLSTCIASDQLWTHGSETPWFSQAPTRLPATGDLLTSFGTSYIHRPIGLRVSSPDPGGTTIYAVENVLGAQLSFAYGFHPRVAMSFIAPFVLYQDGASKADVVGSDQELPHHAMGDVRIGSHVSLLPQSDSSPSKPELAIRFEMSLPTGDIDAFVSSPTVVFAPGLSLRHQLGPLALGGDLGMRIRREAEIAGSLLGTEITASVGTSYAALEEDKLTVSLEAFSRLSLLEQTTRVVHPITSEISYRAADQHLVPAEWLVSIRSGGWFQRRLSFSVGGGSFIPTGPAVPVTAPAARVMASVSLRSR